jgi:pentapeptide repeat protein
MGTFDDFKKKSAIWKAEKEARYKAWEEGGSIGPNPNAPAGPGALVGHLHQHSRWLRTDGRVGERLVAQTKSFSHFEMDGVDFSKAIFANVTFHHAGLSEASFKGAQFFNVTFDHCNLDKTDFTGASGRFVTFEGSNESKANFGEGRTGIEDKGPNRSEVKLVGRAKAKYHSLQS